MISVVVVVVVAVAVAAKLDWTFGRCCVWMAVAGKNTFKIGAAYIFHGRMISIINQ